MFRPPGFRLKPGADLPMGVKGVSERRDFRRIAICFVLLAFWRSGSVLMAVGAAVILLFMLSGCC